MSDLDVPQAPESHRSRSTRRPGRAPSPGAPLVRAAGAALTHRVAASRMRRELCARPPPFAGSLPQLRRRPGLPARRAARPPGSPSRRVQHRLRAADPRSWRRRPPRAKPWTPAA